MSRRMRLRRVCSRCSEEFGIVVRKGLQDVVRCENCGDFQYNAPRTETGERPISVTTVHNDIKPKQRARIIMRATGRCELCGSRELLCVGHILSVKEGLAMNVEPGLLNHDENLLALCTECNLGLGHEPITLQVMVAVLRARVAWVTRDV